METSCPLVSVIIPVYKVENYLRGSVMSVIEQDYKNIEIILVDDGSPDKCPKICDELMAEHSNVIAFHKQNGGLSSARNFGVEKSKGKYLFFLDSDDTIVKNAISAMIEIAEAEHSDVVLTDRYYQLYEGTDKKELLYHFNQEKLYITNPIDFALEVMIERGRAWRAHDVLYKADIIKENQCLFPVGYTAEDIVFNLQFMSYAKKLSFIKIATLNYLKRKGSITATHNKGFFATILFIDGKVGEFLQKNNIDTEENQRKRNSLLSRNVITQFISAYNPKHRLSKSEKKDVLNEMLEHERVKESLKTKMTVPAFNQKLLNIVMVLIHDLLRIKWVKAAELVVGMINKLR